MYVSGDQIVYGSKGVCTVESVGTVDISGIPDEEEYYTLIPIYSKSSKLFAPVNNKNVIMRRVITKNQAMDLINRLKNMECVELENYRVREEYLKKVIHDCDPEELGQAIKTLYLSKKERLLCGKKCIALDEKYLRLAEENLYGELAVALHMEREDVSDFILKNIKEL